MTHQVAAQVWGGALATKDATALQLGDRIVLHGEPFTVRAVGAARVNGEWRSVLEVVADRDDATPIEVRMPYGARVYLVDQEGNP